MSPSVVIECPECRGRIVGEPKSVQIGQFLSCPVCGLRFPCMTREVRQALKSMSGGNVPGLYFKYFA